MRTTDLLLSILIVMLAVFWYRVESGQITNVLVDHALTRTMKLSQEANSVHDRVGAFLNQGHGKTELMRTERR